MRLTLFYFLILSFSLLFDVYDVFFVDFPEVFFENLMHALAVHLNISKRTIQIVIMGPNHVQAEVADHNLGSGT